MPREAIKPTSDTREWYETDTAVYRAGHVAKAWGLTPGQYLALPSRERRFCELYLVAENLKQKAYLDAQKNQGEEGHEDAAFDQRASNWQVEVRRRWKQQTGR